MRHLKLQKPPRPRVRVRELARELEIPETELLAWLREHGEWVLHVQSFVEEPVAAKARSAFRPNDSTPSAPAAPAEASPNRPQPLAGLTPPTVPLARDNNPFVGLQTFRPRTARLEGTSRGSEPVVTVGGPDLPDYSAAGSFRASEAMAPFEWAVRGVEELRQDWLDHGLGLRDARIAQACQEAGLRPSDLSADVSGWTVLDRITRGEAPAQVARLLARQRNQSRNSG